MKFQFYPQNGGSSFVVFCILAGLSISLSYSLSDENDDSLPADLHRQAQRSAAVPYSGGFYGKRSPRGNGGVPFSGGLYGKRKRQLPFVMGAAWNTQDDDRDNQWPAKAYGSYKRAGGVPFSGGFYGKRNAYDYNNDPSKKSVPFSGGLYGR